MASENPFLRHDWLVQLGKIAIVATLAGAGLQSMTFGGWETGALIGLGGTALYGVVMLGFIYLTYRVFGGGNK